MLDMTFESTLFLLGQAMLVGGLSGLTAECINHFSPKTIDGRPMSEYIDDYETR
jgi:hypothetical protein